MMSKMQAHADSMTRMSPEQKEVKNGAVMPYPAGCGGHWRIEDVSNDPFYLSGASAQTLLRTARAAGDRSRTVMSPYPASSNPSTSVEAPPPTSMTGASGSGAARRISSRESRARADTT